MEYTQELGLGEMVVWSGGILKSADPTRGVSCQVVSSTKHHSSLVLPFSLQRRLNLNKKRLPVLVLPVRHVSG